LLRRQYGVIARSQALRHLTVKAIEHKVTSGRWRRVSRGVFVTQTGPLTPGQRAWLAVLASGGDRDPSVCLGGLRALRAWGLRSIEPDGVHVLVPSEHRVRRRAGILDFLALCRRFRLPVPTRQVSRLDRQGRRRFVDAVFDPWHIAVEIDRAHHLEVAQMWDD
jgi:hypothetical protein